MDVATHGVAGLVAARLVTGQAWGRYGAAALAGALGPDLDVVASLWDPLAPLTLHRVATHSPLGGLPLALLGAGLVRSIAAGGFWRLAGVAYLGVLSHIVLDVFTPLGTSLLWPFDSRRWAVGSLYMIDPVLAVILAASLLPSRGWRRPGWQGARVGLVALLAYLLLGVAMMKAVEASWVRALHRQGVSPHRVVVVPAFPGPLRWIGLAERSSEIIRARFWAWRVEAAGASVFEKERPEAGRLEVANHPAVLRFLAVARFPWRQTVREGDAMTVEYHELAFEDHPFGGPMVLRLRLGPSGTVRAVEWGHRL